MFINKLFPGQVAFLIAKAAGWGVECYFNLLGIYWNNMIRKKLQLNSRNLKSVIDLVEKIWTWLCCVVDQRRMHSSIGSVGYDMMHTYTLILE